MLIGFGLILLALGADRRGLGADARQRGDGAGAGAAGARPAAGADRRGALTWVMHSSVAFVLFVISLTGAGLVGLPLALTLVLGANVGGGLIALGLALERAGAGAAGALRQPRLPGDRRARGLPGARPDHRAMAAARRRRRPAGGGLPHPLQPRAGRSSSCRWPAGGAALERLLPDRPGARGGAARPPRPGAPRPAGAGAQRGDPRDARARRQGRADAARGDPALRGLRPRRIDEVAALEDGGRRRPGGDQALPRAADAARADARGERAGAGGGALHHQPRAYRRHHRQGAAAARGQEAQAGPALLRRRLARHPRLPRAHRRADAPGARGLRHPRPRRGARPRRREGPAARGGAPRQPSATSAACATGCRRRSRRARCISTCCATSSGSTPT